MSAANQVNAQSTADNPVWANDLAAQPTSAHAIVIYQFRLDNSELADSERLLSASELQRAGKLKSPDHRRRFVVSHVALRQILGRYCGLEPQQVALQTSGRGKAAIAGWPSGTTPGSEGRLSFSLSRSGLWGLIGVAWNRPLGVDLEIVDREVNVDRLTHDFLSTAEQRYVKSFEGPARTAAFYRVWTLKEAAAKAVGCGLAENPHVVEVVLDDGACSIGMIDGQPVEAQHWSCHQRQVSVGSESLIAAVCAGPLLALGEI